MAEFTLREWLQATLDIGKPKCIKHKTKRLILRWIGDDDHLVTWYYECPVEKCNMEYTLQIAFPFVQIPRG